MLCRKLLRIPLLRYPPLIVRLSSMLVPVFGSSPSVVVYVTYGGHPVIGVGMYCEAICMPGVSCTSTHPLPLHPWHVWSLYFPLPEHTGHISECICCSPSSETIASTPSCSSSQSVQMSFDSGEIAVYRGELGVHLLDEAVL